MTSWFGKLGQGHAIESKMETLYDSSLPSTFLSSWDLLRFVHKAFGFDDLGSLAISFSQFLI